MSFNNEAEEQQTVDDGAGGGLSHAEPPTLTASVNTTAEHTSTQEDT